MRISKFDMARDEFDEAVRNAVKWADVAGCAGVPFSWGLASSQGAWFHVLHDPDVHDDASVRSACSAILGNRDVVSMRIARRAAQG